MVCYLLRKPKAARTEGVAAMTDKYCDGQIGKLTGDTNKVSGSHDMLLCHFEGTMATLEAVSLTMLMIQQGSGSPVQK